MKEQLSALMDDELNEGEALRLIKSMKNNQALRETWNAYHTLGDVLRKTPQLSADFNTQLAQRLAHETTVLAPQRKRSVTAPQRLPLALAASVAAVSLVGILALQITRLNQSLLPVQVATAPLTQQASSPPPLRVQFTGAAPNTYLLAHQEFSPSYAPVYVRAVSAQLESTQ